MAAEHIRHWQVGDVDIARIVEVYGWEDDITMLLPDADPAFVQQFPGCVPHFATPDGKMIISFQCFVLRSKGRTAMIDTCIGNDRAARVRRVHATCRPPSSKTWPPPASRRGSHRRAVHAPALRPRGLEHAPGRRQVGAHVPAGALPLRSARIRTLEAPARNRRLPRPGPHGRLPSIRWWKRAWWNSSIRISGSPTRCR